MDLSPRDQLLSLFSSLIYSMSDPLICLSVKLFISSYCMIDRLLADWVLC